MSPRTIDSFDLCRLVCAFLVVCIHTYPLGPFEPISYPWVRFAVPLFFLISSYLFFSKQHRLGTPPDDTHPRAHNEAQRRALGTYVSRLAALYLFWLAVLLWPTLVLRGYLDGAPPHEALRFVRNLLFDGTFGGSWYLAASIEATTLIWILSPRLSNRTLLIIASFGYVLCCLTTNYRHLFELAQPFYDDVYQRLAVVVPRPQNSVICGFFWILLGKIVADREWGGRDLLRGNRAWLLALVGIVLVASEYHLVTVLMSNATRDCYLSLPLGVLGVFLLLRRSAIEVPHARIMRDASVVLYCTNKTVAMICERENDLGRTYLSGFEEFLIAVAIAAGALLILEWISRHIRWLHWLRVAL